MSLSGKQNNFNSSKIQDEKNIQEVVLEQKKTSKSVGLCVGSYDLLHPGHMKHFESAKKYCDKLIVGITSDYFVKKRKYIAMILFILVSISTFYQGRQLNALIQTSYYSKRASAIRNELDNVNKHINSNSIKKANESIEEIKELLKITTPIPNK